MREPIKLIATVVDIGKIQVFNRPGKDPLQKQMISLETSDDQKLFCEIRKNNFNKANFLRPGHLIEVGIVFSGTEKGDKQYNNIVIYDLDIIG